MASESGTNWQRPLIVSASLVLVVAALYWAQAVMIPVVMAVLFSFILAPPVAAVQRLGLGRVISVLIVVTLACSIVSGIVAVVLWELL